MAKCRVCGKEVVRGVVVHPECLPRFRPALDTQGLAPLESLILTDGQAVSMGTWTGRKFRDLADMLTGPVTGWMRADLLLGVQ